MARPQRLKAGRSEAGRAGSTTSPSTSQTAHLARDDLGCLNVSAIDSALEASVCRALACHGNLPLGRRLGADDKAQCRTCHGGHALNLVDDRGRSRDRHAALAKSVGARVILVALFSAAPAPSGPSRAMPWKPVGATRSNALRGRWASRTRLVFASSGVRSTSFGWALPTLPVTSETRSRSTSTTPHCPRSSRSVVWRTQMPVNAPDRPATWVRPRGAWGLLVFAAEPCRALLLLGTACSATPLDRRACGSTPSPARNHLSRSAPPTKRRIEVSLELVESRPAARGRLSAFRVLSPCRRRAGRLHQPNRARGCQPSRVRG
jgi:hypothetical protein